MGRWSTVAWFSLCIIIFSRFNRGPLIVWMHIFLSKCWIAACDTTDEMARTLSPVEHFIAPTVEYGIRLKASVFGKLAFISNSCLLRITITTALMWGRLLQSTQFSDRFSCKSLVNCVEEMAWVQVLIIAICATLVISKDIAWQRPGCHKVGMLYKKYFKSVQFQVLLNYLLLLYNLLLYIKAFVQNALERNRLDFSI